MSSRPLGTGEILKRNCAGGGGVRWNDRTILRLSIFLVQRRVRVGSASELPHRRAAAPTSSPASVPGQRAVL